MKNNLINTLIAFLLLIPFRLPISILIIRFFNWLLSETTSRPIPDDIFATNIIVTKTIYNIAMSCVFLYGIETMSREKMGRKALNCGDGTYYWWTFALGAMLVAFLVIDGIGINAIFFDNKSK